MLKWETYKLLWNWKETLLQSSKSRFRRSGSDFCLERFSECQSDSQNVILKMIIWVPKRTSWAQWYIAIVYLEDSFYIEVGELMGSPQSSFRRSNYRHHENSMLKWETYNMLWDWKETLLQWSKSRFWRSGSDLSVKTCSDCRLKISVSSRSRRRFRA